MKHSWSSYYVPGTLLGTGGRAENKIMKILCSRGVDILVEGVRLFVDLKPELREITKILNSDTEVLQGLRPATTKSRERQ